MDAFAPKLHPKRALLATILEMSESFCQNNTIDTTLTNGRICDVGSGVEYAIRLTSAPGRLPNQN
jgi:hypothetical protein